MGLQFSQLPDHDFFFVATKSAQQLNHPLLVARRHLAETLEPRFRQLDRVRAAIARLPCAHDKSFTLELVRDAGDVPARDHQTLRQLAHTQPVYASFQLRHEIKARQSGVEFAPKAQANLVLNANST